MKWYTQSGVVVASKFLNRGVGFLGLIYFTNELGAAGYGVYVLFASVTRMLGMFTDFGLSTAVEKRVSEGLRGAVVTTLSLKLPLFGLMSLVVVVFSKGISSYVGSRVALLIVPAIVVSEVGRMLISALSGELRVAEAGVTRLARAVLFVAVGVSLVVFGFGVDGLIWSYVVSWAAVSSWLLWRVPFSVTLPSTDVARSLVAFAKFNFIASFVSSQISQRLDVLVIGLFLTPFHVGAYQVAWQLSGILRIVAGPIGNVVFPHVSSLHSDDDTAEIETMVEQAFTGVLLFALPATFGILLMREGILSVVFAPEFVVASGALSVLLVGRLSSSLNAVSGKLLLGVDRPDLAAVSATVLVVSNLVLNFLLVYLFGLVGAAVATSTALTLHFLLTLYMISGRAPVSFDVRAVAVVGIGSLLMYALLTVVGSHLAVESILDLFALTVAGALTYFSTVLLYRPFRVSLRNVFPSTSG